MIHDVLTSQKIDEYLAHLDDYLRDARSAIRRRNDVYAVRNLLDVAPKTPALLTKLRPTLIDILPNPRIVRALLFDKPPTSNWSVPWHQDRTIAVADRAELPGFTAWTRKAGVLHVQPPADILERMLTVRIHLDEPTGEDGALRVIPSSHRGPIDAEAVTCIVPRGGALLMRPLLFHSSQATRTVRHRRVVHLELANFDLPTPLRWAL